MRLPIGKIVEGVGGNYVVYCDGREYVCKPRGVFRNRGQTPLPGDHVVFEKSDQPSGVIEKILPRQNELGRPAVANIDVVVIVVALSYPTPDYFLIDKVIMACQLHDIVPMICANKMDEEIEENREELMANYEPAKISIVSTSAMCDEGLDVLYALIHKKTAAFAGQSGAGKSTLINALLGYKAMQTEAISKKIDRGKHTTRYTRFFESKNGGFIVDTPGFSRFDLTGIEPGLVKNYYPEFDQPSYACKYDGCMHIHEPICGVKHALEEGRVGLKRYENYKKMLLQLEQSQKKERGY